VALAVVSFLFLFGIQAHSVVTNLVVDTRAGKLQGVARSSAGAEFLGIPYAQAPVGALRWREPLPASPWTEVRDAGTFGAPCAQAILGEWNKHDAETSSEDCLFLNVITPVWPPKTRLPVMFWIHGGANAGGTASSSLYKDGTLVQHGVVMVTVNYRLGIFGFFAHPELTRESPHHASGNYGLMDQIAALRWVHDNIANFGGDPANITVFGQSAGAQDTSLLMTSPLAKGLFHRAIVQSGSALNPPVPSLIESEESGEKLATALKAPTREDALKYLRTLTTEALLKAVTQDPIRPPSVGPNIDGRVIYRSPIQVFAMKQQSPVPLLVGTTTREFGLTAPIEQVRNFIQNLTGNLASRALSLYGLAGDGQGTDDPVYGPVGDQSFADLIFRCPVATQAMWHATLNRDTYQYEFAHAIPGQESQGAVHSSDLPYVFGFYPKAGNISGNFGETDFKLADLIETYWTNFAKTGNPNSGKLPNWPRSDSSQSFIRFTQTGNTAVTSGGLRRPQCDLFREVLKQRLEQTQ
jgi:para-nitrobenzyl esterase